MPKVKTFSVGNGDTFYIKHGTSNFTIIDCHLDKDNCDRIVQEINNEKKEKEITRFISTHPDEDHILGIKILDEKTNISNFYCVDNNAKKEIETDSFKYYCELRDSKKTFNIYKNCTRKWMNKEGEDSNGKFIGNSGISILWPDVSNQDFMDELDKCENYGNANNISPIIRYSIENSASFMWFGDLETDYIDKIFDKVNWTETDIIFAPHHGRKSGALPKKVLDLLNPKIIIIGNASSEDINYYKDYDTITQNSSGDVTFECDGNNVDIYCSESSYSVDFLLNLRKNKYNYYIGTLKV